MSGRVGGADCGLRSDLPPDAKAVLNNVGNPDMRIELHQAGGDSCKVRWCDGKRDSPAGLQRKDLAQEIDPVVMQHVGDGAIAGAVIENAGAAAENGFALGPGRVGEREAGRKVVHVVVEIVLEVVAHAESDGEIRFDAHAVFHKTGDDSFPENDVSIAGLDSETGGFVFIGTADVGESVWC